MVFFHPFVRRIFFDVNDGQESLDREALMRCYVIPLDPSQKVELHAEDANGRRASLRITDLRLFLFANATGILSVGAEARDLPARDALWINEQMRKIYPTSGRQLREGRAPNRYWLTVGGDGDEHTIVEDRYEGSRMQGFQPPLSRIVRALLYFIDYDQYDYEQLLDERMIVYSYAAVDPASVPPDFAGSEACQHLLSRFLYVDHYGEGYRYDEAFVREEMRHKVYRRWAHEGTFYGFTSYSNVTLTLGEVDRGEHRIAEGCLIHRMFESRYYLMSIIALFYRAALLDFEQKTALVSRRLYRDQEFGRITRDNLEIADALRAEFLHFSNYWYFAELANKDEEIEHFAMMCGAYRVGQMKGHVEQQIEKLNASLHEYHASRSTEAVNRLAVVSIIFGFGALVTGFFGMNFGGEFSRLFFEPEADLAWVHWLSLSAVTLMAIGALAFAIYLVVTNPVDYRDILIPGRRKLRSRLRWFSLKKSE